MKGAADGSTYAGWWIGTPLVDMARGIMAMAGGGHLTTCRGLSSPSRSSGTSSTLRGFRPIWAGSRASRSKTDCGARLRNIARMWPVTAVTGPRVRVVMAHAFAVGGAEEMVLNLVQHLPERFEPVVCCINQAGPIGEEIRATGTPVAVLRLNPGVRRPFDLGGIRRYLRETQPHIVHTFLLTASLYGRLAAVLERVPVVIGTEVNIYQHKRWHHAVAERLLMRGTSRVLRRPSWSRIST